MFVSILGISLLELFHVIFLSFCETFTFFQPPTVITTREQPKVILSALSGGKNRKWHGSCGEARAMGWAMASVAPHEEMEECSTSNMQMLAARGTFIADTADGTVTQARDSAKRQRAAVNVSEDLLNRQIQDYGLVSPERAKNAVWCFFKKYGSKKLKGQDDTLKLAQQALCTICLADQARRLHCTVKLGKVFVDGSHEDTSSGRIQCSGSCQ